jgi:hypothetical protein
MKYKLLLLPILLLLTSSVALAEDIDLLKELSPKITDANPAEVRTYKHNDGATITEYKSAGKVWMIKVQPAGNFPAYYLYDRTGEGTFEQRIAGNKQPSPPMWIIKRF